MLPLYILASVLRPFSSSKPSSPVWQIGIACLFPLNPFLPFSSLFFLCRYSRIFNSRWPSFAFSFLLAFLLCPWLQTEPRCRFLWRFYIFPCPSEGCLEAKPCRGSYKTPRPLVPNGYSTTFICRIPFRDSVHMASTWCNPQSDCESEVDDVAVGGRRTDAVVKIEAEVLDASSKKRGWFFDSLDPKRSRQCRVRPERAPIDVQGEYMCSSSFVDVVEATRRQAPCAAVERSPSYPLLEKLVCPLKKGDQEYQDVERKFLSGLERFASGTVVTGISRDASAKGQARLQAFEKLKDITRTVRGDENERFAWHGTTKAGVSGIFLHGFGQPRTPKNGSAYGVGVYLAPEGHSYVSAIYADNDENGEQHIVLCKVILGASELVAYGSDQFHPSSEEFDTGVDDLVSPRRLIVWSTHMNTHILPLYVVSFRLPPVWHQKIAENHGKSVPAAPPTKRYCTARQKCDEAKNGIGTGSFCKRGPTSPFIYFQHLFILLSPLLDPVKLQYLKHCHREFQARRLTRQTLIQRLRNEVGDKPLVHAIKLLQDSQTSKAQSPIKYETSISFTAREEMKCETPLSFTAVERTRETPLSFTAVEKIKCETPLSFTAVEKIESETPLPFTGLNVRARTSFEAR